MEDDISRIPPCYFRAPDWLFMTRSTEGFLLRSKVYIPIDLKPFTFCLSTSLDPVINLYIFIYHLIYSSKLILHLC